MSGFGRRQEEREEVWVPKTKLGKMVAEGKVTSLGEIFRTGQRVREAEIIKKLLPDLRNEVVGVGVVQKQTDAGELTRFGAVVAVGNGGGWFGVGKGKAGSVAVEIIPGPRSLGLVAGPALKNLLALAGIKDAWIRTFGSTSTMSSLANAVYDAFRKSHALSL